MDEKEKIIAKYIRIIHPTDLGKETLELEIILRKMIEELEILKTNKK